VMMLSPGANTTVCSSTRAKFWGLSKGCARQERGQEGNAGAWTVDAP
jgi:hypothetical protein